MCVPAGPFGGELQMWAYLSDKTAGEETERHLETLQTESPLRTPHRWAPPPRAATGPFCGLPFVARSRDASSRQQRRATKPCARPASNRLKNPTARWPSPLKTVVYLNLLLANQAQPVQQLDSQARRFITNPIDPYTRTQTFWRRGRQAIMPPPRAMVRKISSLASWRHAVPARLVTRVPL